MSRAEERKKLFLPLLSPMPLSDPFRRYRKKRRMRKKRGFFLNEREEM